MMLVLLTPRARARRATRTATLALVVLAAACEVEPVDELGLRSGEPDDPTADFLGVPDVGGGWGGGQTWEDSDDCSIYEQDCPTGYKCAPIVGNDFGWPWYAMHCHPLPPQPRATGQTCQVEYEAGAGRRDDCDRGLVCRDVDWRTEAGRCFAIALGSPEVPTCADPSMVAIGPDDGDLVVCRAACHPLDAASCPEGEGCYPNRAAGPSRFACLDVTFHGGGLSGTPCELINHCAPAGQCIDRSQLDQCHAPLCCAGYCDLDAPDCPSGLACTPWYGPDDAPPGLENLGVCVGA